MEGLINEYFFIVTHYFEQCDFCVCLSSVPELVLRIPHVGENFIELSFFLLEPDSPDEHESRVPTPEAFLETLMVGMFFMGGVERVGLAQQEWREE